ncbi:MAG: molybdenum cofactor guanylyltransferase [Gemmatimonadetes bacterium]|nr:molybdenum cofactor guanylyltransferase [Gemmatimonadota bacterium]
MSVPPRLLGAVLAGGEGRRFGGPKAEAAVGGVPMVERAGALLGAVVDSVVVVTSRPLSSPPAPELADRVPGMGPLGGLDAALRHARERGFAGVLLVACDLPLLTPALVRGVVDALGVHPAVAPARRGGGVEPLCAAYRVEVLEAVERRLTLEDRSLHALFRDVGGHALPVAAEGIANPFLNVNTPEERGRAETARRAGGDR